jgi:hypothetical protein
VPDIPGGLLFMGVPMSVSLVNRLSAIDPPSPKPEKPLSPKKLAANRKNSQKSTGPRTQEGKSKVSQNARKHGCSQSTLLPGECTATYEIHLNEIREELHPQTPLQYHLVSQISQIIWKLQRMADTEKELFALNTNDNEFPCQTLARSFSHQSHQQRLRPLRALSAPTPHLLAPSPQPAPPAQKRSPSPIPRRRTQNPGRSPSPHPRMLHSILPTPPTPTSTS